MVSLLVTSALFIPAFLQQPNPVEKQVSGTWTYDTKSVRITLNAAAKKQIDAAGAQGKMQLEDMKTGLANLVSRMTLTFQPDHIFVAELNGMKERNLGKWSLKDREILVVMDKKDQRVPKMSISKDGKRITTVYEDPSLGQGFIDMIRK